MATVSSVRFFPQTTCPFLSKVFNEDIKIVKRKAVPSFWRVKKWHFTADIGLQDRNGNAASYSFDKEIDVRSQTTEAPLYEDDFLGKKTISNEKDLVCADDNHIWGISNTNGDPVDASSFIRIGSNPFIGIDFNDSFSLASRWDGYEVNEGEYQWGNISVELLDQTYNLPMIGVAVGIIHCVDDLPLEFGDSCYYDNNGMPQENLISEAITLRVNSVSGTLKATEYWEYDPNDGGGPIYVTSTGERIRFDV